MSRGRYVFKLILVRKKNVTFLDTKGFRAKLSSNLDLYFTFVIQKVTPIDINLFSRYPASLGEYFSMLVSSFVKGCIGTHTYAPENDVLLISCRSVSTFLYVSCFCVRN